jgi:hypothetical protein
LHRGHAKPVETFVTLHTTPWDRVQSCSSTDNPPACDGFSKIKKKELPARDLRTNPCYTNKSPTAEL